MPRFDKTGPIGDGSMTGWGDGMCNEANDIPGRGRCRVNNVGRGRRRYFNRGQGQNRMVDLSVLPSSSDKNSNNSQAYSEDTNLLLNTLINKIDALEKKMA